MRLIRYALMTFFLTVPHYVMAITVAQKNEFYNGCMKSCQKNQLASPENAFLLDVPFVFDAYCSCYCSRTSLRITKEQYETLARSVIEGGDISQSQLGKVFKRHGEKCLETLAD